MTQQNEPHAGLLFANAFTSLTFTFDNNVVIIGSGFVRCQRNRLVVFDITSLKVGTI